MAGPVSGPAIRCSLVRRSDLPVTPGAFQTVCGSCSANTDAFVSLLPPRPPIAFSPFALNFEYQYLGISSQPLIATLYNVGTVPVTVTSIAITGANSNAFGQTNNCLTTILPNGTCTVSVVFTPTVPQNNSASLTITDNATDSPQGLSLAGIGIGPLVTASPSIVVFPSQYVGTSGLPQTVTLTNSGDANSNLTITSLTTSVADFGTLSNCTNSVQPNTNCTIGVFFDPTASGNRTGTLTIAYNSAESPLTVTLSGAGQDFSMSPSGPATATVSPGQTANYTLTIAPAGGFKQTVTFTCAGAPSGSTCSVPSSFALNGSAPTTVNVAVAIAATSAHLAQPGSSSPLSNRLVIWLALAGLPALVILGKSGAPRRYRSRRFLCALMLACLFSLATTWTACGGGSMAGNTGGGTPAGSYNLTVTGTFAVDSTTLVHKTNLTLVVQ
jgi:hypothetical protein